MRDVSVVTVLFNSEKVIAACLRSLPPDVEVLVVDNCSQDEGAQHAIAARPDAKVIRCERNRGFGGGCNVGWKQATRRYVAFVNPDVRLHEDTLDTLVKRLAREPHGIVGPAMLDSSGTARRCKRRASVFSDVVGLLPASTRWARPGWDGRVPAGDFRHERGGAVPQVEGACFVMRRDDLEAIGGFDEDLFLYQEEESLALRLAALGGRAIYEPAAQAEHEGGDSTELIGALATRHFYRSRVLLYRKRDGNLRGWLAAALMAGAVTLSLPAAAVNTVLRRSRDLRLSRLWNVLRGIAAGATCPTQSALSYRAPRQRAYFGARFSS